MAVSNKHILQQIPVIRALGRTALAAVMQKVRPPADGGSVETPGPELRVVVSPLPKGLVRDYVRHVGGEPSAYKSALPPHLFPQWSFGLASRALEKLPYPFASGLNAGCRLQINTPLPNDEPLDVKAQLVSIDDDGRRALIVTRVTTGTASTPEALVADMRVFIPLGRGGDNGKSGGSKSKRSREKPRVDDGYRELARWRIGTKAGLDFAKLTGDFNPVHWIPPYARAFGFKNVILHGFSTMARAVEGLNHGLFAGATPIRELDVRFTRPLVLPRTVGLYVGGAGADGLAESGSLAVGDAPGGPAYMTGTYKIDPGVLQ